MRVLLTFLLFHVLGIADAYAEARLKVSADRSVVIVVNLVPHPLTGAKYEEAVIEIPNGKEGLQNIRVLNALGQEQWKGQILVQKNQVVKAEWKGRQFKVTDRRNMVNTVTERRKGPQKRPIAGHTVLDDLASSTAHQSGEDDVLAALAEANASEAETETAPEELETPTIVAGEPGQLEFVNRGGWSNVFVDGTLVHEFRGKEKSIVIDLTTGPHEVQFRDFQDREDWGHGTVTVYPDFVVELHFGLPDAPLALNRREAWTNAED
jgi:hypothetical protein